MRRVVITGLGMVAPTGNNVCDAWQTALSGRSAIARISTFDPSSLPVRIAGEVRDFDPSAAMSAKEARQASRFVSFAAVAAKEAIGQSGLDTRAEGDRCGCIIGVGLGSLMTIEEGMEALQQRGPRGVSPFLIPFTIPNMAAGFVAVAHGLRGPGFCTSSACASGTHAIGEALLYLRLGMADVMIAGGAESFTTPLMVSAFARMGALSTRNDAPELACRPFDLDRDGFVVGEGAGLLVLEEFEHARRRGAAILAELVGYGASSDAHHITSPSDDGEGLGRAMRAALDMAQVAPDEVDYINAHGTSTPANDAAESAAIENLFGPHAFDLSVSSTKGVTGHCLGAAGGVEAVYTVLAVQHQVAPPTANYEKPDPACRLDYTPRTARPRKIRYAMSNSAGFGGQNACLLFKLFS